jgi:hypothetical protein
MGTTVVKRNASNIDLQRAIEAAIPTAVAQMKQRSNEFKGKTEAETCKKIFDYLKNQINYKADGSEQQVRVPSGLIRTRQGDCKSYSVFTSAVLTNLGIPHKLVYASYDPNDSTPTHIYVVTNKGCIIDAVYGKFNAEKKASNKKYKDMNISYIAGVRPRTIGASVDTKQFPFHLYITKDGKPHHIDSYRTRSAADKVRKMFREDAKPRVSSKYIGSMGKYGPGGACGIGGVDTGETWAKKLGIWDKISLYDRGLFFKNLINPVYAGGREFVKALLRKNSGGFGNALTAIYNIARADNSTPEFKKYRDLELLWLKKGGNPDELRVAFQEGNTKTPTGAKFHEILVKQKAGQNISNGEWIAAAISAAFGKKYDPATGKITGNRGIGLFGADDAAEAAATAAVWIPIIREVVGILADAFRPAPTQPDPGGNDNGGNNGGGNDGATSSMLLPILLVGGAAAAYFIFKKK